MLGPGRCLAHGEPYARSSGPWSWFYSKFLTSVLPSTNWDWVSAAQMHPEAGRFVMLIFPPSKQPGAAVRAQHPTGLSAVQTQHDKFTSSTGISDFQVTPTVFLTSITWRLSAVKLLVLKWKNRVFVCVVFVLQSQRAKETPGCSHLSV